MTLPLSVEQRIQKIVCDLLQIQAPTADQDLFDSGVLDSLSFVDMLVGLEEEFSVRIPLDRIDLSDFRSITRIAAYVSAQCILIKEVTVGTHSAV